MSATVYYKRIAPLKGKALDGQSTFLAMIQKAFSDNGDIPAHSGDILRAMAVAAPQYANDFNELADASDGGDALHVWAEY